MTGNRQQAKGISTPLGMSRYLRLLLIAFSLLPSAFCLTLASAQSPVEMGVAVDRDVVTVGDRIRVTVTLTLPADAQVTLQELETQFGDLELLLVGLPQDTVLPDGRREVNAVYEVAAFRVGTPELPSLSLTARLPDGSTTTVSTRPLPINVESVIPAGESPTEVRDLKPQVSFAVASGINTRTVALIVAAVAFALALLLLILRRLLRRKPAILSLPVPPPSPEAAARAELDRIASLGLVEKGELKQLHILLAACIRRYLTARYHFPAFAMTTTELRRRMEACGVGRWQARLVAGLLTESDAVNFAQYVPARARCEQNLEMAYQIVDAGEPVAEQPAVQAPATA